MKLANYMMVSSLIALAALPLQAQDGGLKATYVKSNLSEPKVASDVWSKIQLQTITLMAQPMAIPRPKTTQTDALQVQVAHNGKWIAFRLSWKDTEKSEAGPLGKFSDAVAVEFPVKIEGVTPPSVFMGEPGKPVHIYHWRAQYQKDHVEGFHTMKDIYPNMSVDAYPFEFSDRGKLKKSTEQQKRAFVPGQSAGNPQAFQKHGIDEILAEGFGTSSVTKNSESKAYGEWKNGRWTVVIVRPLSSKNGSALVMGKNSYVGFAVWQGGKDEVGSRKSVTLSWTPLILGQK